MSDSETKNVTAEIVSDGRANNQRPEGSFQYDLMNPTVLAMIGDHAGRGLSKAEIAARIGISYRQFKRRCNQHAELNATIIKGWGELLEEMEKKEIELARSGNAFLLPRVIDRLRSMIAQDEEAEMRDVESSEKGHRGSGPVTRDELIAAIKKDPMMQIEGVTDEKADQSDRGSDGPTKPGKKKKKTTRKKAKKTVKKRSNSAARSGDQQKEGQQK